MTKKSFAALSILIVMLALGVTDALLVEKDLLTNWREVAMQIEENEPPVLDASEQVEADPIAGVVKVTEPNIQNVTNVLGFQMQGTTESTLIGQIVPSDVAEVQSAVLLKNGDRAGIIAWVDSAQVKVYFLALKEALHATFSADVKDLVDETQQREGKPTRNLLTFKDPLISEERVVFVRIRERLYELHVANGMDQVMFELIETLTN